MMTTIPVKDPSELATQLAPIMRVIDGVLVSDDSNDNPNRIGAVKGFDECTLMNTGSVVVRVLEAQISTGRNLVPIVPTVQHVLTHGLPMQPGQSIIQKDKFFGWGGFFAACDAGPGELFTI